MAPGLTTPLPDYHATTTSTTSTTSTTATTQSKEDQSYTPPTKEVKHHHHHHHHHRHHHDFSGIKTSGQHPPLYDQLKPYSDFPKEITGPTVWKSEDYASDPDRWTHVFTKDEIAEMSDAADNFHAGNVPLTHISKVCLVPRLFFLFSFFFFLLKSPPLPPPPKKKFISSN